MIIKKFKNGNFNVKHEPKYDNSDNLIEQLCNSSELDFMLAGEVGCLGNYSIYYPLYNAHTDLIYVVTGRDCYKYKQGKTVKLYGRVMDTEELEALNNIIGD